MAKNLVIVESPAKAKTIEKFLGKDFQVESSYGHIADLPSKELGIDVDGDFSPKYIISDDKKPVVKKLKSLAKKADIVWLASDEDREGEAIAWHLSNIINNEKPLKHATGNDNYEIADKIKNKEDLEKAFEVRRRVFVIEQVVDAGEEYDDDDHMCTHFLATVDGESCGTARWRFKEQGIIKLERFAVDAKYRKTGVGAALVKAVLADLPYAEKVMMHAQMHAIPFYEKYGFVAYGPEFDEAGIRHFAMKLVL